MDNNNNDAIEHFIRVYNDFSNFPTMSAVAQELGMAVRTVRDHAQRYREGGVQLINRAASARANVAVYPPTEAQDPDEEVIKENVKLAKRAQRLQDLRRIEAKSFREHARIENAVASYIEDFNKLIAEHRLSKLTKQHVEIGNGFGIMHLSDNHMGELVELAHNQFNWEIAGKRLKKHAEYTKRLCQAFDVRHLLVAFSGDLVNSDRRLDELVANSTNRSRITFLAVDLYQQMLLDLNKDLNLTVCGVSGNESRIGKDVSWVGDIASDNYDWVIYENLRKLFIDAKGVTFIDNYDPSEVVVEVGGQHVLVLHGHGSIKNNSPQRSIQEIKGRYATRLGIKIDMVIWGHVHEAMIGDGYARSSSLVGPNDYAEKALGLTGRASQNFYLINEGSGFHGFKIDLQNVDGIEGYSVQRYLESYNTKAKEKLHVPNTIHRVVI